MQLELTEPQRELVLHILENRLGELRAEIHHSTVSRFTDQLKEMETLLKGVIHELNQMESAGSERR